MAVAACAKASATVDADEGSPDHAELYVLRQSEVATVTGGGEIGTSHAQYWHGDGPRRVKVTM